MRSYPRHSPQAAARIVALLLIADGHVSRSEMDALYGRDIEHELGLPPSAFGKVRWVFMEHLLGGEHSLEYVASQPCNQAGFL